MKHQTRHTFPLQPQPHHKQGLPFIFGNPIILSRENGSESFENLKLRLLSLWPDGPNDLAQEGKKGSGSGMGTLGSWGPFSPFGTSVSHPVCLLRWASQRSRFSYSVWG
jgi:hypothetical protein